MQIGSWAGFPEGFSALLLSSSGELYWMGCCIAGCRSRWHLFKRNASGAVKDASRGKILIIVGIDTDKHLPIRLWYHLETSTEP
jgi:hypothetical protein